MLSTTLGACAGVVTMLTSALVAAQGVVILYRFNRRLIVINNAISAHSYAQIASHKTSLLPLFVPSTKRRN